MSEYTLTVHVDLEPDAAEKAIREALADEGFGILSEIDVQATLQAKLGEDVGPYRILGACNPPLAHRGLGIDRDLGALLPCNVVVRANPDGGCDIVAADPQAMLTIAGDELDELAADAGARIRRALDAVSA